MPTLRRTAIAFSLLLVLTPARAVDRPKVQFNRLVAHWAEYAHKDYLPFIEEAKPEIAQVGFYGGHFYSLAHTPHGAGYPAHFPVVGLDKCGQWFTDLNKELHKRGVKVVGHFNVEFLVGDPDGKDGPTGFFKFYRDLWDEKTLGKRPVADPLDLLEKKADGTLLSDNNYSIGGMREHWACLSNPHWQAVMKTWVKAGIDRGVDGYVANYFYRHNCLCEHCQREFRAYLAGRFTPQQLKAKFQIADITKHKFTEIGGWHDPKQSTEYKRETLRFSQIATKKAFDEVFVKYGRSLKLDLIVAQWNHLGDFGQISGDERCMLPAELWSKDEDYLWYSTGGAAYYTDLKAGFLGEGTLQARYIRGASGGKAYTLGKYESTRTRVSIAELAANGGAPMGFYTNFTNPEARKEIVRYYGFLRENTAIFKGNRPYAEVLLNYPRKRVHNGEVAAVEAFKKQGKHLLDSHVLFDVLPDDVLALAYRYLQTIEVKNDGELVPVALPGLSRFDAPQTVRVSASRPAKGNELTLHFVNYNRTEPAQKHSAGSGIVDEKPIAVEGVKADVVLPAGSKVKRVLALTPEEPKAVELPAKSEAGRIRFIVPRFLVYSVVRIELDEFKLLPKPPQ